MRVLIVDDNEQNLYMLQMLLEGNGYRVETATNGAEALEKARRDPPALIITDILMPVMDGFTLCREWQQDQRLKETPFVFYTATYTDPKDETFALSLGAERFIVKPAEPDVFVGMVRQVIKEAEEGRLRAPGKPVEEEPIYLKTYNERLVKKLEDKMLQLERDIAERKRAEEKLLESEERFRDLYENAPNAYFSVGVEGLVQRCNRRAEELTGYPRKELLGKPVSELYADTPQGKEKASELFRQFLAGDRIADEGLQMQKADGTLIWISLTVNVVRDADGQIVESRSMVVDITERRRAEQALRESEAKFRALAETAPAAIFIYQDTGLRYVNPAAEALSGYSAEELLAMDFLDLVHPDFRDVAKRRSLARQKGESAPSRYEFKIVTKSGEERWLDFTAGPIEFEGRPAVIGTAYDITDRKRAEEALRESEEKYRHLVEAANATIFAVDLDGVFLFMNSIAAQQVGGQPENLVGKTMGDVFPPEVAEPQVAGAREIIRSGQGRVQESETILQGESRWYRTHGQPLCDDAGNTYAAMFIGTDITERVRAEEALRESEERLRGLVNASPDLIFLFDEEGYYLEILTSQEQLLVRDAEELIGKRVTDALPDGLAQLYLEALNRTLESGDIENVEYELDVATGSRWFEGRFAPVSQLVSGKRTALLVSRDITERKRTEKSLQRYTERLRALRAIDGAILAAWSPEEIAQAALRRLRQLVPSLGAGIALFDFETQEATLFARDVDGEVWLEKGMRFPLEQIVGVEVLRQGKVLVEEDLAALLQPPPPVEILWAAGVRSYIAAPLVAHGELIGALSLGAEKPAAFTPEQIDIAREVADQVAVALHQARLRAALEAEQQRLETLVEHVPEGILLLDGRRRILLSNPVAQTILPILTDAAVGDVLPHLADRPIDELLESPPEGAWHELEIAGPRPRFFEVAARPLGAEPKVDGWTLVIRNATEEREVQQRVQQQERLAAVGQLAGGIAHDFNNMLTAIMLYAQMPLSKRDLSPDLKRALETILDESRKAAKLVQQVLDFSRKSPIEIQPVDLRPFVKEAVRVLQRTIPESISILLEVEAGEYAAPLTVDADPTRIQQVLMNLAINARDAMPEGGTLRIGLSAERVGPGDDVPVAGMSPGEWVCLAVSDTGAGIPPEVLPHVFEPFFTTKEPGRGTGLGLAQVYGIVTQHGGHIGVETEVGRGTTFRVYLPAYQAAEEEVPQEEVALAAPQGRGETILVVEDSERIREAARGILESLGYRVLTAENGREALELYRSVQGISLVLTDVVMPEMGGAELMRELRKMDLDLKALAITGYLLGEDLEALKAAGILDVIYKPLEASTLAQVIRSVLDAD